MPPYKIRADLRVNDGWRKLVLVAISTERPEHLGLKLAAYLSFWFDELTLEASSKHPALAGTPFRPDLLGTDITGAISIWVECGNTTNNKLAKVLRKWPDARVAVFKQSESEARRYREDLTKNVPRSERVEIYAWKDGVFKEWMDCLSEKIDIFGDCGGVMFNLVVGEFIFMHDLVKA
jgi:uncharacterized protein YaeQ